MRDVPDHLKTQEICSETVRREPYTLRYAADHLKTQRICEKAVEDEPETLEYISNHFKSRGCVKGPLKMNHTS